MNEKSKIRLTAIGIIILTILAIAINFYPQLEKTGLTLPGFLNFPFRLGLDLQGGTQLIYEADLSEIPELDKASSVEGVRDVIERRVNAFGVAEPVVQVTQSGGASRILVELAGVHDINQAIKMIGETPLLEFKEQNPNPQVELTADQKKEMGAYNIQAEKKAKEVLNKVLAPNADFAALAKEYSEDAGSAANGGELGFQKRGTFVAEFEKVCFDQLKVGQTARTLTKTAYGYHIIKKENEQGQDSTYEADCRHILIKTKSETDFVKPEEWLYTGLTGKQLAKAQVQFDPNTQTPEVSLQFNDEGKKLFGEITQRNINKPVAIFLDGEAISVPTVQEAITGGQAVISGKFGVQEAKLLAQRLNSGALPVPIKLVSQQTVGASLGNKSIEESLKAGIIGLIAIALFMLLYYRLPGLVSVIALIIYGLLVLMIFKIFSVTLTLAGIAGFILSLGMAVDANILIFARLKEELHAGKSLDLALIEGFKRAWPSIFASNISSLITCGILITFSTSIVRGFAITLSIGIIISMFSAIFITRVLLELLPVNKLQSHMWLFGAKKSKVTT